MQKIKKLLFVLLALVLIITGMISLYSEKNYAASREKSSYVKSLSTSSKVILKKSNSKSIKVRVKTKGNASKKFTAKSANTKIAKVYVKKGKILIKARKTGRTKIIVRTKGRNRYGKKISKVIKVTVKKKSSSANQQPRPNPRPPVPEKPVPDTPQKSYTREEWVVALMDAISMDKIVDEPYSYDDFADAQQPDKIETAIRRGLVPIKADEDNMVYFKPDENATREFVAYTAIHALDYEISQESGLECADKKDLVYPQEDSLSVKTGMFPLINGYFQPNQYISSKDVDAVINAIKAIINSAEVESEQAESVTYMPGVQESQLLYELDEEESRVYINDPQSVQGWNVGEIHVLRSTDNVQEDIAIKIIDMGVSFDGQIYIDYEEPQLGEVVNSFEKVGSTSTEGVFIPAEGVTVDDIEPNEKVRISRAVASGEVDLFGKKKISLNIGGISAEGIFDLKNLEYRLSASPSWHLITINEVYFALNSSVELNVNMMKEADDNKRIPVGEFKCPLGYGFNASGEIYFIFNASGGVEAGFEVTMKNGVQYVKGQGIRSVSDAEGEWKSMALKGTVKTGLSFEVGGEFLGIDLVSIGAEGGLAFEGKMDNVAIQPVQFCLDGTLYMFLGLFAQIGWDDLNLKFDKEIMNSDNSLIRKNLHFEEAGVVSECTRGSGNYDGYVKRADNAIPIYGAKIQILEDGNIKDTTYTDTHGRFVGVKLKSGEYRLRISAAGYLPYEQTITIVGGQITSLEPQLMIAKNSQGESGYRLKCSGRITDAYTGYAIEGAKISVYSQFLFGNGELVEEIYSDENGNYEFSAPVGNYELTVVKDGYLVNYKNIALILNRDNVHFLLNSSEYIDLGDGPLSDDLLAIIKDELKIPSDVQVDCVLGEKYYWDVGERWMVYVAFTINDNIVACAEVDANTGELIRGVITYNPPN